MTDLDPSIYVHPSAVLLGNYSIAEHSSVWPYAVIRADYDRIDIGSYSSVQDCAVLHAAPAGPIKVGDYVTLGHSVVLHACTVEDYCVIGINATVLDGAVVGKGTIVAAGAVVRTGAKIPPGSFVVGVPAEVKPGKPGQLETIRRGALLYHELTKKYLEGQTSIELTELMKAMSEYEK